MKSQAFQSLPPKVTRSLAKLGADLSYARKKRSLTVQMVAERVGVAKSTYIRVERGDPTVSMGVYAMAFFVLGFGEALGELADARGDAQGLFLDITRLPQRVRVKRTLKAL
ncbi:MAG: helix-turn-helix domain-containing protein [Burkholderiales bacterium]